MKSLPYRAWPAAVAAVLAVLPFSAVDVPVLFDGPFAQPGTLQLLAMCLIFAGVVQSYDLQFGRSGLMSFGHALYFAAGAYPTCVLVRAGWPLWQAAAAALCAGTLLAVVLGAIALHTEGIGFAMVTLAFAQAGTLTISLNPAGLTGGDEGLALNGPGLPAWLTGVTNTANLYWLALAYVCAAVAVVWLLMASPAGRIITGVRDDARRVSVLGLNSYVVKLSMFTLSGVLAAAGGIVYVLTTGGVSPHVASTAFTLTLLVMVVIGGPGTRWGPVLGAVVYTYLDQRLTAVSGAVSVSPGTPGWLAGLLSQPLLLLGIVFILLVYFAPGGLSALRPRLDITSPGHFQKARRR
ncbi:branched-chain amino acid ABC transporter permease [Acrocarpospora pleiomorpha]|uniref:Branched-chain amino acid ABC transporter permease n=1 Tax=Acrocarpospora pleiomorpha TaxID=90975 RepID=A0A5M3XUD6_9ACTN|nr:branched-chain amino acid ABC transporter permease [Acrocarpospora pleiomorpha]GES23619.1 branched-chain amino acid ABC transporter permease [Acrocarpospora pleiomorpha]